MNVLCFSPNDAVWLWAKPQAQVLKALKDRGDTIHYAHCDRTITDFCMAMAASGVSHDAGKEQKDRICALCVKQSSLLRNFIGVGGFPIHNYVQAADREDARRISDETPIDQLAEFCLEGVPIGRFAFYEAMLQTKSLSASLDAQAEKIYRTIVRNSFIVTLATSRMIAELKPNIGLTYHALYSYNRCFAFLMERRRIPVWSLNASANVTKIDTHLIFGRTAYTVRHLLQVWPQQSGIAVTSREASSTGDHIVALMAGGGRGYSTPLAPSARSIDDRLCIKPGRKVLSAMLSSYDELRASQMAGLDPNTDNVTFPTQVDWVKWLFEFARARRDVHVVIRVHPREFRATSNGAISPHVQLLKEAFSNYPANVSINLPEDRVSNYELLMRSDAVTVAWTSVGEEAALFGIPVVTYFDEALGYPADLTDLGRTLEQYEHTLDRALAAGWSLERSRRAFRWSALLLSRPCIDVSNGARISLRQSHLEVFSRRVLRKLRRTLLPGSEAWWSLRAAPSSLTDAGKIYRLIDSAADMLVDLDRAGEQPSSPDEELAAIRDQLARISFAVRHSTGAPAAKLDAMLNCTPPLDTLAGQTP
jgi:hypothetical protein